MVSVTLKHMASQPIASAELLVKKALLFLNQRELFINDNFYFMKRYSSVLSLPLPDFALIGVLGLAGVLWRVRRWESAAHLYAMLLVQIASYTLIFVLARYRLLAAACLMLFASSFITDVIQVAKARRRNTLALAVAAALGCALLVNIRFAEFPYERGFREISRDIERIQSQRREGARGLPTSREGLSYIEEGESVSADTSLNLASKRSRMGSRVASISSSRSAR
jgi:hypothetical protein